MVTGIQIQRLTKEIPICQFLFMGSDIRRRLLSAGAYCYEAQLSISSSVALSDAVQVDAFSDTDIELTLSKMFADTCV